MLTSASYLQWKWSDCFAPNILCNILKVYQLIKLIVTMVFSPKLSNRSDGESSTKNT